MLGGGSCVQEVSLWYFTVTLDPYLLWFFIKAAKSLIYSYPPECSQGFCVGFPGLGCRFIR